MIINTTKNQFPLDDDFISQINSAARGPLLNDGAFEVRIRSLRYPLIDRLEMVWFGHNCVHVLYFYEFGYTINKQYFFCL